ncbi:MAG: hypothetical protein MZV63_65110 [Marinilabiliales bacterium]|nr:hypothetical protein [Marinilabiliales bacterium]
MPRDVGDEPGEGRARRDERQVDREVLLPAFLLAIGLVDRAELLGLPFLGALFDPGLDAVPPLPLRRRLVVGRSLGGRAEDEVVLPAKLLGCFHAEGARQKGLFEGDLGFRPDRIDERGDHVAELGHDQLEERPHEQDGHERRPRSRGARRYHRAQREIGEQEHRGREEHDKDLRRRVPAEDRDPAQDEEQKAGQEGGGEGRPQGEVAAGDLAREDGVPRQAVRQHGPQGARLLLSGDDVGGEKEADQTEDHLNEEDEIELALDGENGFLAVRGFAGLGPLLGEFVVAGEGPLEAPGVHGQEGRATEALDGHRAGHDVLDTEGRRRLRGQPDLLVIVPDPFRVVELVDVHPQGDEDHGDQPEKRETVAEDVLQELFLDDRFPHGRFAPISGSA